MIHTLDRVEIAGYKSLRQLDLAIQPINVLVGANGAGKTNFLEVFDLVGEMIRGNLRKAVGRLGGPDRLFHGGLKRTTELRVRLQFGRNGYEATLAASRGAGLYFEREECWGHGYGHEKEFVVPLGAGHGESLLAQEASEPSHKIAQITLETMQSWRRFHVHDTSESAASRQPQPINDNRVLRRDAANLAPFLRRLRLNNPASYGRVVDAVRRVAPFFRDFVLEPTALNEHLISLEWVPADGDYYGDPHALSDGTLRFMCLATLLLQPDPPSLILIDEPELGLHPSAIVHLADLIRAVPDDHRIILSTQSVTLLNQFDISDIVVVDRNDGASTCTRPDEEALASWLDEYAIGDLWEKNLIGGRPSRV